MKLIHKLIPAEDKLKHFYVGAWIFFILTLVIPSPPLALFILLCIAVGKEVYDGATKTGKSETLDIVYTVLPGILFFVYYILYL